MIEYLEIETGLIVCRYQLPLKKGEQIFYLWRYESEQETHLTEEQAFISRFMLLNDMCSS